MNKKYLLPFISVLVMLLITTVLISGCGEVAEIGTGIAQAGGIITSSQADSITKSTKAIEKSQQELTSEQEYYVGRAVVASVLQTYKPLDRPQQNNYLNLLGQSLAIFSNCPETFGGYHFLLLDSDEINAFAAPGGLILVTRGMLRCCNNEDELAAVLAHEICHVELKHGLKAIKQGRMTEALTILAAESAKQLGSEELASLTENFEESVSDVVMTLTTSGYSRDQERDADAAAAQLLRRAGYPEAAMITMLRRMDERISDSGGHGFAKTHPSASSRIDSLRTTITNTQFVPDAVRQERFTAAMQTILAWY
ncbi:MAG: M48 family metallopeptidase [Sedimentisphaerales bacterium]|nr:M48 family metallopeptidase [Sedimentisphaerales bacterium]